GPDRLARGGVGAGPAEDSERGGRTTEAAAPFVRGFAVLTRTTGRTPGMPEARAITSRPSRSGGRASRTAPRLTATAGEKRLDEPGWAGLRAASFVGGHLVLQGMIGSACWAFRWLQSSWSSRPSRFSSGQVAGLANVRDRVALGGPNGPGPARPTG